MRFWVSVIREFKNRIPTNNSSWLSWLPELDYCLQLPIDFSNNNTDKRPWTSPKIGRRSRDWLEYKESAERVYLRHLTRQRRCRSCRTDLRPRVVLDGDPRLILRLHPVDGCLKSFGRRKQEVSNTLETCKSRSPFNLCDVTRSNIVYRQVRKVPLIVWPDYFSDISRRYQKRIRFPSVSFPCS